MVLKNVFTGQHFPVLVTDHGARAGAEAGVVEQDDPSASG